MKGAFSAQRMPLLFFNPAGDRSFVDRARLLLADGVTDSADLERRLRDVHPKAVVRPRDLADEAIEVWYVYRDGHWVPG